MRIGLVTVDLLPGRERLMPWRTLIEIARFSMLNGHVAEIIPLSVQKEIKDYEYDNIIIKSAPRDFSKFCIFANNEKFDVIVYPTPWREGLKNLSAFKNLNGKKVAYFPGGSYRIENIISLWKNVGFNIAKPYLIDWLTPYSKLMGKLQDLGFSSVIAQSPFTYETCKKGGFKDVQLIVPGKDDFETLEDDFTVFSKYGIKNKKYLLFSGAPAPIRGGAYLIDIIDRLAEKDNTLFCLFLMRRDVGSNYIQFEKAYQKMKHKECVQILDVRLNRNELKTFISHARAVILPFHLIPSEIPITYFEVMSVGTPIVTFENGGTTEYLNNCILQSKPGNKKNMAHNIKSIWDNDNLYDELSTNAKKFMLKHPTWNEVGKLWLETLIKI